MFEATISVADPEALMPLFGPSDRHVRQIRESLGVAVTARNGSIHVAGSEEAVRTATQVIEKLQHRLHLRGALFTEDVNDILSHVGQTTSGMVEKPPIAILADARQIHPRTAGQQKYVDAIAKNELVFGIGPAGTGKTFLAVAMAVAALKKEAIKKIVLVRPAVEAGESLGFLPGDIEAKINPYLRPLLDALRDIIDYEQFKRYTEQDVIEVIPLAYMRGRTLNDAFIILDEAQNASIAQMKMFLTRMGIGSKIVVAGDITQIDLPPHQKSGLVDAVKRLRNIAGFQSIELTESDIVRHRLVQEIVRAYDDPKTISRKEDQK
ncbi:MAG: phosphate starvation-inducible protein PhoH [Planctomycetaceae bacterium TMED10]|nr:MAG: phosphate starvation-inducible protein PhoH [Planctomycetaceae bacterium TMED10]|tara:strand:- start:719 stop:1684 length:966 start_codon:yes stop_codon:yes gene_type:complete